MNKTGAKTEPSGRSSRRKKLASVLALVLCICTVGGAMPALFAVAGGEEKDADTRYVNRFEELPEDIREQHIALGG